MKADVLSLAALLGAAQPSAAMLDRYYVELVRRLGVERDWITQATLVAGVAEQATYTLPDGSVQVLGVLYDDRELVEERRLSLDAHSPHWRDRIGRPQGWVVDGDSREVRLFPRPRTASSPFIPLLGDPMSSDYPVDNVVFVHTEERVDVPEWMELFVALRLVGEEFIRDSSHRDAAAAAAALSLAEHVSSAIA